MIRGCVTGKVVHLLLCVSFLFLFPLFPIPLYLFLKWALSPCKDGRNSFYCVESPKWDVWASSSCRVLPDRGDIMEKIWCLISRNITTGVLSIHCAGVLRTKSCRIWSVVKATKMKFCCCFCRDKAQNIWSRMWISTGNNSYFLQQKTSEMVLNYLCTWSCLVYSKQSPKNPIILKCLANCNDSLKLRWPLAAWDWLGLTCQVRAAGGQQLLATDFFVPTTEAAGTWHSNLLLLLFIPREDITILPPFGTPKDS